ncbi:hypothetical protein [Plebeiibacterium sediminum]|uniref:Uncharacterized protein n=1 Tax=Plebeiibacterium sediminum TaxID=2992112 RepID=A0AAE3M4S7_9BACT|nr:hypothetical protein [Plebeiobacterium sediminum]MCW3787207.1 hypothetical protein [Plebeiobacterium sediminum]
MKNFLYLTLIILTGIIFSCKTSSPEPPPQTTLGAYTPYFVFNETLNGKLKSVKEINYWAIKSDEGITKGSVITTKERDSLQWSNDFIATYNENGLITQNTYSIGDDFISKWVVENENTKISKAFYYRDDTLWRYDTYTYDESGFTNAQILNYPVDSTKRTFTFVNDSLGNWHKLKYFDAEDNLKRVYTCNRDTKNRITKEYMFDQNDSLLMTMEASYNEYGFYNLSRSSYGSEASSMVVKVDYTAYDHKKNWTSANITINDSIYLVCDRVYEYY